MDKSSFSKCRGCNNYFKPSTINQLYCPMCETEFKKTGSYPVKQTLENSVKTENNETIIPIDYYKDTNYNRLLSENQSVFLHIETDLNTRKKDVRIISITGKKIGFIPEFYAKQMISQLLQGKQIKAYVRSGKLHFSFIDTKEGFNSYEKTDDPVFISRSHEKNDSTERVEEYDEFITKLKGVSYDNADGENRQDIISELKFNGQLEVGQKLYLKREPDNLIDKFAIAVLGPDKRQIGFIPQQYTMQLSGYLDKGESVMVYVKEVTGGDIGSNYGINITVRYPKKIVPVHAKTKELDDGFEVPF